MAKRKSKPSAAKLTAENKRLRAKLKTIRGAATVSKPKRSRRKKS